MPNGEGRNLNGQDLRNADLRDANLTRATLKKADLRGANLSRANLNDAILLLADLREANLKQLNFGSRTREISSNLMYAHPRNADLGGAIFERSNPMFADLRVADLSFIDFSWGRCRTQLVRINLSMANLKEARLIDLNMRNSNFIGANFGRNGFILNRIFDLSFTFAHNLPEAQFGQRWEGNNICPDGTTAGNNSAFSVDQLILLA